MGDGISDIDDLDRGPARVKERVMSLHYSIRIATPEDEARVSALLAASYPALMASSYAPAVLEGALPLMTRANPALLASGSYYLVETADRRIVACGGWTHARPGDGLLTPGLAHIRHFGTHPDCLRHGLGRAIYRRSERDARAAGAGRFECYASLNSEGFYAALGFESRRRIALELRPGLTLPAVLMTRAL